MKIKVIISFLSPGEAPSFVSTFTDIRVDYKQTVVLEAKIKGEPMPEVVWLFKGVKISDTRYRFVLCYLVCVVY